jgi:uncharacterized membrane protein
LTVIYFPFVFFGSGSVLKFISLHFEFLNHRGRENTKKHREFSVFLREFCAAVVHSLINILN